VKPQKQKQQKKTGEKEEEKREIRSDWAIHETRMIVERSREPTTRRMDGDVEGAEAGTNVLKNILEFFSARLASRSGRAVCA